MVRIELSRDDARLLEMFLLLTTRYREDQVLAYRMLLEGRDTKGLAPAVLQKYADNAQHWAQQCEVMDGIRKEISRLLATPDES